MPRGWVALAIVAACGKGGDRAPAASSSTAPAAAPDARPVTGTNPFATGEIPVPQPMLEFTTIDSTTAEALPHLGTIDGAYRFRDRTGENAVLVSSERSVSQVDGSDATTRRLWIVHLRWTAAGPVAVRTMKDLVEKCVGDPALDLDADPALSDLDDDQLGEITVVYKIGCRTDVSPIGLKVLLLEDGTKYAVRGRTHIGGAGGERELDPRDPPAVFASHLLARFAEHVEEQP